MLGRPQEARDLLTLYREQARPPWTALLLTGIAAALKGDAEEAAAYAELALGIYRERETLHRLPLSEGRLWKGVVGSDAWEKMAPFFDEEP